MKVTIDTRARTLRPDDGAAEMDLYAPESFAVLSELWVKVGWALKHSYGFSWFGRPVIQLPEDMIRIQEVLYRVRPDVVIETGIAHGGSLVYYAGLLKAMGRGRVVGVDIEIRPPNRAAIESHPLSSLITLIEGDSAAPATVAAVRGRLQAGERALVVLDSNHTRQHVLRELEAYAPLVSVGSYMVVTDGVMGALHDVPRRIHRRRSGPADPGRPRLQRGLGFCRLKGRDTKQDSPIDTELRSRWRGPSWFVHRENRLR
jgi:cephalosporin hydroxylase